MPSSSPACIGSTASAKRPRARRRKAAALKHERLIRCGEAGRGLGPGAIEEARQAVSSEAEVHRASLNGRTRSPAGSALGKPRSSPPAGAPPGSRGRRRRRGVASLPGCRGGPAPPDAGAHRGGGCLPARRGTVALEIFREEGTHKRMGVEGLRLLSHPPPPAGCAPVGRRRRDASPRPRGPPAVP